MPTLKILVFDSEPEELILALPVNIYQIRQARTTQEALRDIELHFPQLIISDLFAKNEDARPLWERAHKHNPTLPILVVSALHVPQFINIKRQKNFYFLPKPIDIPRFQQIVSNLLHKENIKEHTSNIYLISNDTSLSELLKETLPSYGFQVSIRSTELTEWLDIPPAALLVDYRQPTPVLRKFILQVKNQRVSMPIVLIEQMSSIDQELLSCCDVLPFPLNLPLIAKTLHQSIQFQLLEERNLILSKQFFDQKTSIHQSFHPSPALVQGDLNQGEFMEQVVHDLKSPISAVLGTLNFLKNAPSLELPSVYTNLLNSGLSAGEQLLRQVESLLESQRLANGVVEPENEPLEVDDLLLEVTERFIPLFTIHHLHIVTEIAPDLPIGYADAYLVQRILENLLDNAVKFAPRDSTVKVSITTSEASLKILVHDEGIGIPPKDHVVIFNKFAQIKQEKKLPRGSFGLGLSFCKQAIRLMGGKIWVESDGSQGATFVFTLPMLDMT